MSSIEYAVQCTIIVIIPQHSFLRVVSRNKSVEFSLDGNNLPPKLLKKETGEVYLTDRRTIFLCSDSKNLHSFSADFRSLSNVNVSILVTFH